MGNFYITVSNGLLEDDHEKRMGAAVWQFMWLLDKITKIDKDGLGWVLGGKPIKLDEMAKNKSRITVSRNLQTLKKNGYINLKHTPYGIIISVNKAKKRFNKSDKPEIQNIDYEAQIREKMSLDRKGENHYNWKGGITPENHAIRNSLEYKIWRLEIFERDKFTCQLCKKKGDKLHAHHIKSFSEYPDLRFEILNGITFCEKCHQIIHKTGLSKMIKSETETINLISEMINLIKTVSVDSNNKTISADKPRKDKFETDKYPKENYIKVLSEYQKIKDIKLQGDEFLPPMREIKIMFKSGRTVDQIIETMGICEDNYDDWSMNTVRMKIADVVGGKLTSKNTTKNKGIVVMGRVIT